MWVAPVSSPWGECFPPARPSSEHYGPIRANMLVISRIQDTPVFVFVTRSDASCDSIEVHAITRRLVCQLWYCESFHDPKAELQSAEEAAASGQLVAPLQHLHGCS